MSSEKPSGMPTLPLEWSWKSFDELCDRISVGHVGETNSFFCGEEGIPFLRSQNVRPGRLDISDIKFVTKDFHAKSKKSQLSAGDILIVRVGQNRGDCAVVPEGLGELNCANIVLAKPNRHYSNYLGYFFNSPLGREALLALSSGSAQLVLNTKAIAKVIVPVPPEEDALKIGLFLKMIDDRIALLRETNATLEAIAQALFKSWFVDFDPVHAKQQGRAPEGMDEATAALFPDEFEESELGLVPRGWSLKSIGDISEILNGSAFKSEDYINEESGVFVLRTTNFSDDGYAKRLVKDVFLPTSFLKSHAKFICEPFDFHLVMVGASVGRTSTLLPNMLPALRNQNMWCFRPMTDFPSKFFIHETVKLKVVEALRSTSGSAREFLRKGDFEKNKIVLPPYELLCIFEDILSNLKNRIAVNESQSDLLMKIRDKLLPRLISGQLRLPDTTDTFTEILTGT
jgi:type I restriction enzyme S subunit